jgi:2-hydroxycyclohexanecarboxyl-CoA dehydrogenase
MATATRKGFAMEFSDQTAVVTGAGSGIGRAIALAFAGGGATVFAADLDTAAAERTAAERTAAGPGTITARGVDVTSGESVRALRDEVLRRAGQVNIVVNAAGIDVTEPFLNNTEKLWDDLVAVNYLGPVRVCRAFLDPMIEAGAGGKIVNLGSDAGRVGSTGETVYAGTKGGVIAFTKSLAREVARHQINVNCVCPGPTDTPMLAAQPEQIRQAITRAIPFRRVAEPAEIADAVLFFASGRARYITGQVLSVSGGLTMVG